MARFKFKTAAEQSEAKRSSGGGVSSQEESFSVCSRMNKIHANPRFLCSARLGQRQQQPSISASRSAPATASNCLCIHQPPARFQRRLSKREMQRDLNHSGMECRCFFIVCVLLIIGIISSRSSELGALTTATRRLFIVFASASSWRLGAGCS